VGRQKKGRDSRVLREKRGIWWGFLWGGDAGGVVVVLSMGAP